MAAEAPGDRERLLVYLGTTAAMRQRLESTLRIVELIQGYCDDETMDHSLRFSMIDAHAGTLHRLVGNTLDFVERETSQVHPVQYSRDPNEGEPRPSRGELG